MAQIQTEEQYAEEQEKLRLLRKLRGNMALFGRVCLEGAFQKDVPPFHADIYRELTNRAVDRLLVAAPRGSAKAQSLDSRVLTPTGWRTIGELSVGDYVIGSDGTPTAVTHLHPIDNMDLYRVETRDGRSTLCNREHLWSVIIPQNTGHHNPVVKPLHHLAGIYTKTRRDNRDGSVYEENKVHLPTGAPVAFPEKKLPIDPYTLGLWLGDGHSAGARFTTADPEVLGYSTFRSEKKSGKYLYQFYGLETLLRRNGLLNNKHIPDEYLLGSIEQREALLQGLIDTDGTVDKTGTLCSFCNKNERLIDGVVDLVRSLGGTGKKAEQWTRPFISDKYFRSFRVSIRLPNGIAPARLKRKRDRWRGSNRTYSSITNIKYSHTGLGRCITVQNADGLYITDDYMLTHNSTVISLVFPIFEAMFTSSDETKFILIISESQGQAINFLSRIKSHLESSPVIRQLFGEFNGNTSKRWTSDDIILANGVRIKAVGTRQRVRGFIEQDVRPTLIIVDDFESELNALTQEARAQNRLWLTNAVIPSLADNGRMVIIGTPISEDCFLYWAKGSKAWKTLWFSIIDDKGNSIWPDKFPIERINKIREEYASVGNLLGFYQEMMCIAQPPDEAPFKPKYIQMHHMEYDVVNGQQVLKQRQGDGWKYTQISVYMGIDPASSLKLRADFFVIAVLGIDPDDNVYIIDIFRDHLDPAYQPDKIFDYYEKYHPKLVRIETTGYQETLRSSMRRMMAEKDMYIPGLEKGVKPRTSKNERLFGLVPMFAKGRFYFRPEDEAARIEFLSYPRGQHDDIPDAIWTALYKYRPPRKRELDFKSQEVRESKRCTDWMVL